MKYLFLISILVILMSCQNENVNVDLEGKIFIEYLQKKKVIFYHNGISDVINIPNSDSVEYELSGWLNSKDIYIASEYHRNKYKAIMSNLVLMNEKGEITKRINEPIKGLYMANAVSSFNDSLILYTSNSAENKNDPNDIFYRRINVHVIDYEKNQILYLERFCPDAYFHLTERAWSPFDYRFVYSVSENFRSVVIGQKPIKRIKPENGIYIYNLKNKTHLKISEEGFNAAWSPKGDMIAYVHKNDIFIYNIKSNEKMMLYKHEWFERIYKYHWSPDGKYIFFFSKKYYFNTRMLSRFDEKLIDVKTQRKVNFNKLNLTSHHYILWK
jgi:WD40 repeat protein